MTRDSFHYSLKQSDSEQAYRTAMVWLVTGCGILLVGLFIIYQHADRIRDALQLTGAV